MFLCVIKLNTNQVHNTKHDYDPTTVIALRAYFKNATKSKVWKLCVNLASGKAVCAWLYLITALHCGAAVAAHFSSSNYIQHISNELKPPLISHQTMHPDAYLSDVLMVIPCVFLQQKELIPHPSTFGAVQNLLIAFWNPKKSPNIPRVERQGFAGVQGTY